VVAEERPKGVQVGVPEGPTEPMTSVVEGVPGMAEAERGWPGGEALRGRLWRTASETPGAVAAFCQSGEAGPWRTWKTGAWDYRGPSS